MECGERNLRAQWGYRISRKGFLLKLLRGFKTSQKGGSSISEKIKVEFSSTVNHRTPQAETLRATDGGTSL